MFPAESMIGKYVYFIRRPGREDGMLTGGVVTGVDSVGRLEVQTDNGARIWTMDQVTTDPAMA